MSLLKSSSQLRKALRPSHLYVFDDYFRRWVQIPLHPFSKPHASPITRTAICRFQNQRKLTLASWNIDAFANRPTARASRIVETLLKQKRVPDIIFLQEVQEDIYEYLLRDERIRQGFFVSDAVERRAFEGVPFTTSILMSRRRFVPGYIGDIAEEEAANDNRIQLGPTNRIKLPSNYGRDGLSIDLRSTLGTTVRLINVHLDSLKDAFPNRAEQIKIVVSHLREVGCARGLIAGDFNALSPEDNGLIYENGLRDQWIDLHEEHASGYTWGIHLQGQENGEKRPARLDKVATFGLQGIDMEILHPGTIAVPRPGQTDKEELCSDHSGLLFSFFG